MKILNILVKESFDFGEDGTLNDPDNGKLARRLAENLMDALGTELKKGQTMTKLESLIADLLEEIKFSYVHSDAAKKS